MRDQLIKLGTQNPHLRKHLRSLLAHFTKESGLTLYRGLGPEGVGANQSPFVWFSFERALAQEYANFKGDGGVQTFEYGPKHMLDIGRSEQKMSIKSLLSEVNKRSKRNLMQIKEPALALRQVLWERYGDSTRSIDKFWYADEQVAEYIELLGFDSILTTEAGVKTLGVLKKYVPRSLWK